MTRDYLSNEQIDFFKENGFLVVENLIPPEILKNWQTMISRFFGFDHTGSGAVNTSKDDREKFQLAPQDSLSRQSKLMGIVEQLVGTGCRLGNEEFINRKAKPDQHWVMPPSGHIDLLFKTFRLRFMFGVTVYAYEVGPKGGGFVFWPRSHQGVWQYFRESPADHYGEGEGGGLGWVKDQLNKTVTTEPVEFVARPGTALIWHSFMLHNGSMNVSNRPRIAIIGRWAQPLKPGEPHENFGDMWEHWAI